MISTLLTLGGVGGLAATGWGLLAIFAGSMSDAPYEGEAAAHQGLIIAGVGLAVFIVCVGIGLYRRLS